MRRRSLLAVAAAFVLVSPAAARVAVPRTSLIAMAGRPVAVYAHAGGGRPVQTLQATTGLGAPRTFLVRGRVGPWLDVLLPERPNGATGWIRADAVTLAATRYAIVVELHAHLLTLTRDGALVLQVPVGIGQSVTPTPTGEFFVTELMQLVGDQSGIYGPFALGLSAFSEAIRTFNGAPAQIAIHGTNDPASIGRDESAGCIRMANRDVSRLAHLVPLGTPVLIVP